MSGQVKTTATAHCIKSLSPDIVTFVETGVRSKGGGEEDSACADYIASLIPGTPLDYADIENRTVTSRAAAKFLNSDIPNFSSADFPPADLQHALRFDHYPFAMKVDSEAGNLVLRPVKLTSSSQVAG